MSDKQLKVVEIFGPVIQGEGAMAGQQTHFLRMGGCDYRCVLDTSLVTGFPPKGGPNPSKIRICDVKVDDIILGFDEETNTLKPTTVTRVIIEPHLSDLCTMISVTNEQMRVATTEEDLWYTQRGWVPTKEIRPDDDVWVTTDCGMDKLSYTWAGIIASKATEEYWLMQKRVGELLIRGHLEYAYNDHTYIGTRMPTFIQEHTRKAIEVRSQYEPKPSTEIAQNYANEGWKLFEVVFTEGHDDDALLEELTQFTLNGKKVRIHYTDRPPSKPREMYDLECHPYPTFFVNKFLKHNCSWCDSLYAVDPEEVKLNSTPMTAQEIVAQLEALPGCKTLTISGGNPCMWDLSDVVEELKLRGWYIAVETQGTIWREWLSMCDLITVSPKPPSSDMVTESHNKQHAHFLKSLLECLVNYTALRACFKIVVFDNNDFQWAITRLQDTYTLLGEFFADRSTFFLQPGTDINYDIDEQRYEILARTRWVTEKLLAMSTAKYDPLQRRIRVIPQLHTLVYGSKTRGV